MTTVELLRAARERIEDPAHWCQGQTRMLKDDGNVGYCSVGAVLVCRGGVSGMFALDALARATGLPFEEGTPAVGSFVGKFNDSHTHEEVLALFDRAISNEEAREQEFTESPVTEVVAC